MTSRQLEFSSVRKILPVSLKLIFETGVKFIELTGLGADGPKCL